MNFFKLFHPCSFLFVITSVMSSSTYGGACEHIISISPKFSNLDLNSSSGISPLALIGVGTPPPAKPI